MTKLLLQTALSVIFTVSIVFTGCNKVKGLLDINFDANFSVDMSVDALDSGTGFGVFDVEETLDPLADEEVQKYIDNIKDWAVTDLKIKFSQVNPEFDLSECIASMFLDEKTVTWYIADQHVINGDEVNLGNEENQWSMVNEIIKQKKPFTITLSGKTTPASQFKVQLIFNSKITANPL